MRKIIVFGMAFVMLLSVAMLGAAACDGAEDNPNLGPCGYAVCVCSALAQHQTTAKETLQNHVLTLEARDFIRTDWAEIQEHKKQGIEAIYAATNISRVDYALASTKEKIEKIVPWDQMGQEWGFSECLNFALNIRLENDTIEKNENALINAQFKNLSGKSFYIAIVGKFINPYRVILPAIFSGITTLLFLEKNIILEDTWEIGPIRTQPDEWINWGQYDFIKSTHPLIFYTILYLDWRHDSVGTGITVYDDAFVFFFSNIIVLNIK